MLAVAFLLTAIQLSTPTYAQGDEVECWAVMVGVSSYREISDLDFCDDDAQELANELSPAWGEDHIRLLANSSATKRNIGDAVTDWLAPLEDEDDIVLFFFSGHGGWEFICPYDSLIDSYDNDIFASELDSWLNVLDSAKIIVILDSCESGSFLGGLSANGRLVLTACSSTESAYDDDILRHGVFCYYIIEALNSFEDADANDNYELSVEEIFNYAQPKTTDYEQAQHPEMSDNYGGELSLLIKVVANVEPDMAQDISILNIAGQTYSPEELPASFIWAPGSSHYLEALPPASGGSGSECVFNSWSDGNTQASREILGGGVYTANYQTLYYLTVLSAYGNPQGEGWYEAGSTATISVTSPQGGIIRQVFSSWSGDFSTTTPTAFIYMNGPQTVTASWRTDYLLLFVTAGAGGMVLIGGIIALVILLRRRG